MEFIVLLFFLFVWLAKGLEAYNKFKKLEKRKVSWKRLAASNELTFLPGTFMFSGGQIKGTYRGFNLNVSTFETGNRRKGKKIYTAVNLGRTNTAAIVQSVIPLSEDEMVHNFRLGGSRLSGVNCTIDVYAHSLRYQEEGALLSQGKLQATIDKLRDLAMVYPRIVLLGGEAVPFLQSTAMRNQHPLAATARRLLQEIESYTKSTFKRKAEQVRCEECLTCFAEHKVDLGLWSSTEYYACRTCKKSQYYYDVEGLKLFLVLDNEMQEDIIKHHRLVFINWLKRQELVDFDEVKIEQASDEEVASFAVSIGNDTDEFRAERYGDMRCVVSANCQLSSNTMHMLKRVFGRVVVRNTS